MIKDKVDHENKDYIYEVTIEGDTICIIQNEVKSTGEKVRVASYDIRKLDTGSPFDIFFRFVFDKAGEEVSESSIKNCLREKGSKEYTISKMVSNLGFTEQMKKAFFPGSFNIIKFRKVLTKEDIKTDGIIEQFLIEELSCKRGFVRKFVNFAKETLTRYSNNSTLI